MKEVWKDIKGYEGYYQISNLGNVKRLFFKNGKCQMLKKEKILVLNYDKKYKKVRLSKNGIVKNYSVHRLVAEAFIPNPQNLPNVLHKKAVSDGGTNDIDNLYWGTQKDNIRDTIRDGHYIIKKPMLNKKGILNPLSKKVNQYTIDGKYIKTWNSLADIERKTKISHGNISQCCNGIKKQSNGYIWKFKEEE